MGDAGVALDVAAFLGTLNAFWTGSWIPGVLLVRSLAWVAFPSYVDRILGGLTEKNRPQAIPILQARSRTADA